jgi:hypothetical protein
LKLYFSDGKKFYLTMDRTNWYWGKHKINVFMLAIAYEGVAIPVFWRLLPKAGNSNVKEQKEILTEFFKKIDTSRITGLLADREFGSGKLFNWLNKKNIPFYIRIKEGSSVNIQKKKFATAKKLFNHLGPKTHTAYPMTVWVFGQKVYLAGSRSEKGELMIVATNQSPCTAIACYLRRWEIENLFACLKGRGFHFEDTHMTHLERIEKLMALLAIGVAWAHKVGEWRALRKPIVFNRYRDSQRPQYSYFRYGLDFIQEALLQPTGKLAQLRQCIQQIILPKSNQKEAML